MFKNLRKKKKGFTLIELIIVIAIIAILAAVAIPKFGDVRSNAAIKSDVANAKTIANAATVLIGEGKITLTQTTKTLIIDSGTGEDTNADAEAIEGYLQNVPTPKSQTGKFTATIDKDGNVKVLANSVEFFPATAAQVD